MFRRFPLIFMVQQSRKELTLRFEVRSVSRSPLQKVCCLNPSNLLLDLLRIHSSKEIDAIKLEFGSPFNAVFMAVATF